MGTNPCLVVFKTFSYGDYMPERYTYFTYQNGTHLLRLSRIAFFFFRKCVSCLLSGQVLWHCCLIIKHSFIKNSRCRFFPKSCLKKKRSKWNVSRKSRINNVFLFSILFKVQHGLTLLTMYVKSMETQSCIFSAKCRDKSKADWDKIQNVHDLCYHIR